MTPEEEEKRRLRRERNKLAAFRCRQRRKQHIVELEQVKNGHVCGVCYGLHSDESNCYLN